MDVVMVILAGLTIFGRFGYVRLQYLSELTLTEEVMLKPELAISAASAVMATAAVAATIWQGSLARQHNRKAVTPHLRIDSGVDDNGRVIVRKSNSGVGPAIIHRTECIVDNISPEIYGGRGLRAAIVQTGLDNYHYIYSVPVQGEFLGVGESTPLIKFDPVDETVQRIIKSQLSRISIHIVYECIYGKTHCVMHTPFVWERPDRTVLPRAKCTTKHEPL